MESLTTLPPEVYQALAESFMIVLHAAWRHPIAVLYFLEFGAHVLHLPKMSAGVKLGLTIVAAWFE